MFKNHLYSEIVSSLTQNWRDLYYWNENCHDIIIKHK